MPIGSASDLSFILRDAGVPFLYDGRWYAGVFDTSDGIQSTSDGMGVQVKVTTLLVETADALTWTLDGTVQVFPRAPRKRANESLKQWGERARALHSGSAYVVRHYDTEDDGALTRVQIAKVTA